MFSVMLSINNKQQVQNKKKEQNVSCMGGGYKEKSERVRREGDLNILIFYK